MIRGLNETQPILQGARNMSNRGTNHASDRMWNFACQFGSDQKRGVVAAADIGISYVMKLISHFLNCRRCPKTLDHAHVGALPKVAMLFSRTIAPKHNRIRI